MMPCLAFFPSLIMVEWNRSVTVCPFLCIYIRSWPVHVAQVNIRPIHLFLESPGDVDFCSEAELRSGVLNDDVLIDIELRHSAVYFIADHVVD